MTGQVKNLIHTGDLMAQSQIEPLRDLGLDFLTFTDGESETKISAEFTVLTKKENKTGLTFAVRPGDYMRHRAGWWDVWATVPEQARYVLRDADGRGMREASQIKPLNFALTELSVPGGFTNFKMVNYGSHYHVEVGTRRMFPTGLGEIGGLMFVNEADTPAQDTQADLAQPRAELYPWATPDLVANNGWTIPWVQPTVEMRKPAEKAPVASTSTVGGRIFYSAKDLELEHGDILTVRNPDNVAHTPLNAYISTEVATPFSPFATSYSVAAPSRVKGKLCYGIASYEATDYGHLRPWSRSPLWKSRGAAKRVRYVGRDHEGDFTAYATPAYTYRVLQNHLEPRLMAPTVARVGPSSLCMVVHSAPMGKPPADQGGHRAHSRAVFDTYHDFVGVEPYNADYTQEVWNLKATAPVPENHSFIFWSATNGRVWVQQENTTWHENITGVMKTWHSKAALSMASHMTRHTVLIQDTEHSCLMVVALPHCVEENFDFSTVKYDDPVPSFAHHRPKGLYVSRAGSDVYWAPHLPHDKLGFYDPVEPFDGRQAWYTPLDDAYFNTRLWRWAVYRVTQAGVTYLTSLPAEFPPCDYAVSRTSGPTRSRLFIQLKPIYHREQPSVLLVSEDRGLTWRQNNLPKTGSNVGLVYPFFKDELVLSMRDSHVSEGRRKSTVYLMRSKDFGKTWARWETLFARNESLLYDYPDFIATDMAYGTPYIFGRGFGLEMSDGWYGCDFTVLTDEDGEPADLNLSRPWLNDSSKRAPL